MQEPITKDTIFQLPSDLIREVLNYINLFKKKIFVLKIEDTVIKSSLFPILIKDIALLQKMGISIIIIPGSKHTIDNALEKEKQPIKIINHIRVTPEETLPLIKNCVFEVANYFFSIFSEQQIQSTVGNWVTAREIGVLDGVDYQKTGKITSVHKSTLLSLLEKSIIPIITNLGWNSNGDMYNISSNELATHVAKSVNASKLFFIGDEPGIPYFESTKNSTASPQFFSSIELNQAEEVLTTKNNQLNNKSLELLKFSVDACKKGVHRVHIINGKEEGILLKELFSSKGHGTMLHTNVHSNIKKATKKHVTDIFQLIQLYVEQGILLPRTLQEITEALSSYYIYTIDEQIYASCSFTCFDNEHGHIEALVVNPIYKSQNIGNQMVDYLLLQAQKNGIKYVSAMTTQSSDFFLKIGFKKGNIDDLPKQKQTMYNNKRKSKVFIKTL